MDIMGDGDVASIRKIKEEPIENEKLRKLAFEREALREAGTHVWHDEHGLLPIEEAEAMIMATPRAKREKFQREFRGCPRTSVVKKWQPKDAAVEISDKPAAPSSAPSDAK